MAMKMAMMMATYSVHQMVMQMATYSVHQMAVRMASNLVYQMAVKMAAYSKMALHLARQMDMQMA